MKFLTGFLLGFSIISLVETNLQPIYAMDPIDPNVSYKKRSRIETHETKSKKHKSGTDKFIFRLGFEFQASGSLCPNAPKSSFIQKKAIFEAITETKEKLWHVEIDGTDIEFVTVSFSDKDDDKLKKCVQSIHDVFLDLSQILQTKDFTFQEWLTHLQEKLYHRDSNKGVHIIQSEFFNRVENINIKMPHNWQPKFQPQVTIQHPLEYTVPLYFSLFGFNDNNYMLHFVTSLPGFNMISTSFASLQEEGNFEQWKNISKFFRNKLNGLVFLHALAIDTMAALEDQTDQQLLNETLIGLKESGQVDAKKKIPLMSRRPFSSMWHNIATHEKVIKILEGSNTYPSYFKEMMEDNDMFIKGRKAPELIFKSNYAKQFFDDFGNSIPLYNLYEHLFDQAFLKENEEILEKLLNEGVVSTTMIRNFHAVKSSGSYQILNSANEYYMNSIETVAQPNYRYIINNEGKIEKNKWDYDMFSPPWFLDEDDSMGKHKDEIDSQFGEAIIEVRGIRNVQASFLGKSGIQIKQIGDFLVYPDSMTHHAGSLFKFLQSFGQEENSLDINLGMSYIIGRM